MLPIFPFALGLLAGAGAIYMFKSQKGREILESGKLYACEKFEETKEELSTLGTTVKEKLNSVAECKKSDKEDSSCCQTQESEKGEKI